MNRPEDPARSTSAAALLSIAPPPSQGERLLMTSSSLPPSPTFLLFPFAFFFFLQREPPPPGGLPRRVCVLRVMISESPSDPDGQSFVSPWHPARLHISAGCHFLYRRPGELFHIWNGPVVSLLADTSGDSDSDGSALCLFCRRERERETETPQSFLFFCFFLRGVGGLFSRAKERKKIINLLLKSASISYSGRISL